MKWTKPLRWQQKLINEHIYILGSPSTAVVIDMDGNAGNVIPATGIAGIIPIDLLAPSKTNALDKELDETLRFLKAHNTKIAPDAKEKLKDAVTEAGLKNRPANHLYDLTSEERLRRDQIASHFMRHPEITSHVIEKPRKFSVANPSDVFTLKSIILAAPAGKSSESIHQPNA